MQYFLTSKFGNINELKIYRYSLTEDLLKNQQQKEKFLSWLSRSKENYLYSQNENQIVLLNELNEQETWQYNFSSAKYLAPPFENCGEVSTYVAKLIRDSFGILYKQYLSDNIYIIEEEQIGPFFLLKCVQFNVEVHVNGQIKVHFLPVSKIVSGQEIDRSYIENLRSNLKSNDEYYCRVVELKRFRSVKFDLNSTKAIEKLLDFVSKKEKVLMTFDYKFLNGFSSRIFGSVVKSTKKDIAKSVSFLKRVIESVQFPSQFNFADKPFEKVEPISLAKKNNLVVGGGALVNKQSACHFNGVFKPAENSVILPINFGTQSFIESIEVFEELNLGYDVEVLQEIFCKESDDSTKEVLEVLSSLKDKGKRYLALIFSPYRLMTATLDLFQKQKFHYQLYCGGMQRARLANFYVRVIEKLGGKVAQLDTIGEDEGTYVVGIDLAHNHAREDKLTNLGTTFFDIHGNKVYQFVHKNLSLSEGITNEMIWKNLNQFYEFLKRNKLKNPNKLIFHRDGKCHDSDIDALVKHSKRQLDVHEVEVLEVIKSGFPMLGSWNETSYGTWKSGDLYCDESNDYAILLTNDQCSIENSVNRPLIIKKVYGQSSIKKLAAQVYWFTKVYTNNLYQSTRLPATTHLANNIATTSTKSFIPSYSA